MTIDEGAAEAPEDSTPSDITPTVTPTGVAPTTASERLEFLDLLRGFALCGILLMNIPLMGQYDALDTPPLPAELNPGWIVWWVQTVFFEGTMRGLFTLLFGAGMVLMTMRGDREHGSIAIADVYFRRCLGLIILGIINFTVLAWRGDILYMYGFAALFLFMFRRLKPPTLFVLAGLILALLTVGMGAGVRSQAASYAEGREIVAIHAPGGELTDEQKDALTDEEKSAVRAYERAQEKLNPTPETLAKEAERRSNYLSAIVWNAERWARYGVGPMMIAGILESLAFMFIGVGLFKQGVVTGGKSLKFYLLLTGIAYGIGLPLNIWEQVSLWNAGFEPTVWLSQSTYEIGRLAMTLGHLGLVAVLWKLKVLGFIATGLKAIGKMALSNYLGQSLITSVLFYGFGLFARFDWAQLWALAAAIWVVQAIVSLIWLRFFRVGPMDWLLRCFAYARWQPIR